MAIVKSYGGGETASHPAVLGKDNGSKSVFVETTGLYMGLLKGTQAWVTGDGVQPGVACGSLVPLGIPIDSLVAPPKRVVVVKIPDNEGVREVDAAAIKNRRTTAGDDVAVTETVTETVIETATETVIIEVDVDDEPAVESSYDPGEHPVSAVVSYISDHPDEAADILVKEAAGRNRKTLLREFVD